MGKRAFYVNLRGLDDAIRRTKSAKAQLLQEVDDETERSAVRVVNQAKQDAPRKTGQLANSIKINERQQGMRTVGSDKDYAARQEYEHVTKKGFFRKALWNERSTYRNKLRDILDRVGGD